MSHELLCARCSQAIAEDRATPLCSACFAILLATSHESDRRQVAFLRSELSERDKTARRRAWRDRLAFLNREAPGARRRTTD